MVGCQVQYRDGSEIRVGDTIAIDISYRGLVVASIDTGDYSEAYPATQWSYLGGGILVDTDFGGLVHYPPGHGEDLVLVERRDAA